MVIPCDDLTCHLVARVGKLTSETEICELESPVSRNEQVVWLQILS